MDWGLVLVLGKGFVLGNKNGWGDMPKYEHVGKSWQM